MERRKFIASGGAILTTSLAGCSDETDGETNGSEGNDDEEDTENESTVAETLERVDPTVTDLRHPEPQAVSTNDESLSGTRHQFNVTVENTGMAGDVELTLVLLEDIERSVWSPLAEEAGTYQRFFSNGERRTESFSAEWDGSYEAFGFRLLPAEAEVDVRNDGAAGEVEVRLLQDGGMADGTIIESKDVELAAETTETVPFTVDASFVVEQDIDDIQLAAEVVSTGSTD